MAVSKRVICVDLDGTLINTDLSVDAAKKFVRKNIFNVFRLTFWFFKGIQYLKCKVAEETEIDVSILPYNSGFLSYLNKRKSEGCQVYLATGSTKKYAKQVADHLQIFDGVFASDTEVNFIGKNKAAKLVEVFQEGGFDYAGNSMDDIPVWMKANKKILVSPTPKVLKAMELIPYILFKNDLE